eukprot:TRINITY_DN1858_c1_g1_i2.p1 TRINITY_DN1858_c1_g1~~TRINITY_DN1858_c1_g1_i2.p1  ORF type:complete len:398 (+),score=57.02 TRINITY_DN1858_c1_g1_i2:167-1360(+)
MYNPQQQPMMLVNCSHCRTPLQLPPGAPSIRCAICQKVTHIMTQQPTQPVQPGLSLHPPAAGNATINQPPPQQENYTALYPAGYNPGSPRAPPAASNPAGYAPMGPPAPGGGRKKAVLIGVTYRNTDHMLKGCINDVKCMKHLLVTKFGFQEPNIIMLTEDEWDPTRTPTRHNIFMAIYWLVQGCQPGDSLVFHFSGHGSQKRNLTGEEADGYDETILPCDWQRAGMIIDDELSMYLVRPIMPGVKLHAIIDACHSGTVLDLPYLCQFNQYGQVQWLDHRPPTGKWVYTSGGEAFCFSGCDDNQTSADTSALSKVTSTGAMTFCFIRAVERGMGHTYGQLLNSMRWDIRNTDVGQNDPLTGLLGMLISGGSYIAGGLTQIPQLSADRIFDINKPFTL